MNLKENGITIVDNVKYLTHLSYLALPSFIYSMPLKQYRLWTTYFGISHHTIPFRKAEHCRHNTDFMFQNSISFSLVEGKERKLCFVQTTVVLGKQSNEIRAYRNFQMGSI